MRLFVEVLVQEPKFTFLVLSLGLPIFLPSQNKPVQSRKGPFPVALVRHPVHGNASNDGPGNEKRNEEECEHASGYPSGVGVVVEVFADVPLKVVERPSDHVGEHLQGLTKLLLVFDAFLEQ